ncbi:hypothetical protein SAMN02745945_02448 [Peptoclostridium litorale DSM 5388]|uniref:DUF951 domain-containing protein n=1 Tax=Peptoclostridium litorale DSM 5388 TaxID=1121324 RepID=A0A069RH69_PEPLI|nr:DUF951 domain-containing protein [Peptoclostridium litorale]KDR96366.1 hypothetical protein CLIT_4c02040 [Peptoclostridium litorale DSM 5388]SIO27063.1 hypothetical protein SAMN02745945_02448 [Peptoclostridium litorale DSM 5388]
MPLKLNVGDKLILKKSHPCGGDEFEITRAGMDFRIKCLGCGKEVWISRVNLEKRIKKIIQPEDKK